MTALQTKKAANEIAGSLGFPSKMPGTSYGLPAAHCVTGRDIGHHRRDDMRNVLCV